MTTPRSFAFGTMVVLGACLSVPGCNGFGPPPSDDGSGVTSLPLCLACSSDANCRVFDPCIIGGGNVCREGRCWGDRVTSVDYSCVQSVGGCAAGTPTPTPTPTPGCGTTGAPEEQIRQTLVRTSCWFHQVRPSDARYEFGWIVAVADTGGTIEIMRANVLGVRYDGTIVPIQGSALGQRPFTYAGSYLRSPWFGIHDTHVDVPLPASEPYRFDVGTGDVLHIILGGVDVSAYREAYMMVQARTTGDVRFEVGLDYDSNLTVDFVGGVAEVREDGGVSGWGRCSDGNPLGITLSSPIESDPHFCGYRAITTTPSPMPPPTGSRDFVFEPGSRFTTTDTCASGWVTTVWGATTADNLVSAPGGSIRSATPLTWSGITALTMECASPHHWMNWDPWRTRTLADVPNLGTLTMCGADIRALVRVEDMAYARPVFGWESVRGACR